MKLNIKKNYEFTKFCKQKKSIQKLLIFIDGSQKLN